MSFRSELLDVFDRLRAYGIDARDALSVRDEVSGRAVISAEIFAHYPGATGSYIFWLESDDAMFDDDGELRAGAKLPLYISGEEVSTAAIAICDEAGIDLGVADEPLCLMAASLQR